MAGVCQRAASGCASPDPSRKVTDIVRQHNFPLLSELQGHAGIEPLIADGYELVVI